MSVGENTQYSTNEVLVFVLKHKWKYFFLLVTVFGVSLFFLRYRVLTYTSTATVNVFYGVKNEIKNERNLPDYLLPTDQLSAVMNAISSAPMEDHLIKRFGLYEHYGIDTTSEFYQGQAVKRLRSSISLKKTPYNTIDITVNDPYRYVAYEIANEIENNIAKLKIDTFRNMINFKLSKNDSNTFTVCLDNGLVLFGNYIVLATGVEFNTANFS